MYIFSIVICAFVLLHTAHATRISLRNLFLKRQKPTVGGAHQRQSTGLFKPAGSSATPSAPGTTLMAPGITMPHLKNEPARPPKDQEERQWEPANSIDSRLANFELLVRDVEALNDDDPRDLIIEINECRRSVQALLEKSGSAEQNGEYSFLAMRLDDYIEKKYAEFVRGKQDEQIRRISHISHLVVGLSNLDNMRQKLSYLNEWSGYLRIVEMLRMLENTIEQVKTWQSADPEVDCAFIRSLGTEIVDALEKRSQDEESRKKYNELSESYDGWVKEQKDKEEQRRTAQMQRIKKRGAPKHSTVSSEQLESLTSSLSAYTVPPIIRFLNAHFGLACYCNVQSEAMGKIESNLVNALVDYFIRHPESPSDKKFDVTLSLFAKRNRGSATNCSGACTEATVPEQVDRFISAVHLVHNLKNVLTSEDLREIEQYAREIIYKVQASKHHKIK